ncbi:MAG: hypothetical protein ACOCRO_03285 [Halanaerobiales bacterium]
MNKNDSYEENKINLIVKQILDKCQKQGVFSFMGYHSCSRTRCV